MGKEKLDEVRQTTEKSESASSIFSHCFINALKEPLVGASQLFGAHKNDLVCEPALQNLDGINKLAAQGGQLIGNAVLFIGAASLFLLA